MNIGRLLTPFDEDFKFLLEIKSFLILKLQQYADGKLEWSDSVLSSGVYHQLPDGKCIRLVLPRSKVETLDMLKVTQLKHLNTVENSTYKLDQKIISKSEDEEFTSISNSAKDDGKSFETGFSEMNFVGFIGFCRPRESLSDAVIKKCWSADKIMIDEMLNQKHLMAYVTAEREIGGNWNNLVICNSPDGIEEWKNFFYHSKMVTEVAPEYYSKVQIHRGRLLQGLLSKQFNVKQTIFLNYTVKDNGSSFDTERHCEVWKTEESSSYFFTNNQRDLQTTLF